MPSGGMEGPREQRDAGIYSQANEVEERRARVAAAGSREPPPARGGAGSLAVSVRTAYWPVGLGRVSDGLTGVRARPRFRGRGP